MVKKDIDRLIKLEKKWLSSNLENKYNLFSKIIIEENSFNIFNKNNNNYLLIFIIPDINDEFRVYTDDDYLVIKSKNIIKFLSNYLKEYFLF